MGTVRNFIDIEGISLCNDLPKNINGQVIQTSETENIPLTNIKTDIKNIFQILINVDIHSTKTINTPINNIVVVDGLKKFKIIYYDKFDKAGIVDIETPYNTFIELENKKQEIKDIKVNVLDAYFQLIEHNTLYSHLLYYIDVEYSNKNTNDKFTPKPKSKDNLANLKPMNVAANYDSSQLKVSIENSVFQEMSLSKDNSTKKAKLPIEDDVTLVDKWTAFVDMDEEYL